VGPPFNPTGLKGYFNREKEGVHERREEGGWRPIGGEGARRRGLFIIGIIIDFMGRLCYIYGIIMESCGL
jgi:hypothetical protein